MRWKFLFLNVRRGTYLSRGLNVVNAPFFPGLFFYIYIESPNQKNPEGPTPQAQTPSTDNPNPENPIKERPQTTIN